MVYPVVACLYEEGQIETEAVRRRALKVGRFRLDLAVGSGAQPHASQDRHTVARFMSIPQRPACMILALGIGEFRYGNSQQNQICRPDRLAGTHILCIRYRRVRQNRRLVRRADKTRVESAGLVIRPGMDGALHHDGLGRLARMATRRMETTTLAADAVSGTVGTQRLMDAALLRAATPWPGIRGDSRFAGRCYIDSRGILARQAGCRRLLVPYALWTTFAAVLNFTIWRLNT